MTVIKEEVSPQIPRHRRRGAPTQGHTGKHQGRQEAEIDERGLRPRAFVGDFVGKSGQGRMDMMSKLRIGKFE